MSPFLFKHIDIVLATPIIFILLLATVYVSTSILQQEHFQTAIYSAQSAAFMTDKDLSIDLWIAIT